MRLHRIGKEYEDRVTVRTRFFPLELLRPGGPSRPLLEQEWWLAAIQERTAAFAPYPAGDWPTTTLPAFDAAWAAKNQGHAIATDSDLRVRRAFFGEVGNIGRPEVLLDIAREASLDIPRFQRDVGNQQARGEVLEESRIGREQFHVHGTPTLTLADGTHLRTRSCRRATVTTISEASYLLVDTSPHFGAIGESDAHFDEGNHLSR